MKTAQRAVIFYLLAIIAELGGSSAVNVGVLTDTSTAEKIFIFLILPAIFTTVATIATRKNNGGF